jgi:hypothetical protein
LTAKHIVRGSYAIGLISLVLGFFLINLLGCSTSKSAIRSLMPRRHDLKKRVMILPLLDQSNLKKGLTAQATTEFFELLNQSPNLVVHKAPEGMSMPASSKSPELGIVIPSEDIREAQTLDMNALVTGVFHPIEASNEKRGIWPFRDWHRVCRFSMVVNVVDIASGTLLLTKLHSEEATFSLEEDETPNEQEISDWISQKALPRVLKAQAAAVLDVLGNTPWSGRILGVENGVLQINAGRDVGLLPGQRFEVFSWGDSVAAKGGHTYRLLGKKIGEIEVTAVNDTHALARPLAEGTFLAGQVIRFLP